jgi:hypothetical protein
MRLIDLDATIANIAEPSIYDLTDTEEFLREQPTIDAVPVVHGYWRWNPKTLASNCSVCGEKERVWGVPFCKWCGAKMDGVANES